MKIDNDPTLLPMLSLCAGLLLAAAGCERPQTPKLDLRDSPTLYERPAGNCESLLDEKGEPAGFAVSEGEVFYVVHALPEDIANPEDLPELEIEIETACAQQRYTLRHDDDGLVSVAVAAPPGASCGVIVRAEIAGSTASCRLPALEQGCTVDCPAVEPSEDEAGTGGSSDTDTGSDTSTDTTGP